jgi:uncharacterized protein YukE
MSNPDPKPGRWILPLIIIGMVGFTYFFVSSLPTPEPEGTTSTSAAVTTTTGSGTSSSEPTTTTTLASDATFADTKAAFQNAIEKAQVLDDSLTTVTPPAGYTALASLHADLSTAAAQVLSTTQSALAGLQSSDTGEARTAAIAAFNQAVAEFNSAYEGLAAAASEAPDTSG